ncbi:MAG: DNA internalization-related competence protein ComEC/Rec2 [Bacteroidetes bacterium]|nr:DNA internalization-related competence protein ComEC/Rec2 [Bacteroidota bacterium]
MKYPAMFAALLIGLGVLLAEASSTWLLPLGFSWFGLATLFYLRARQVESKRVVTCAAVLYTAAALFGIVGSSVLNTLARSVPDPKGISQWAALGPPVILEGRIRRLSHGRNTVGIAEIDVSSFVYASVRWESRGRVRIRSFPLESNVHPGDVVRLSGSLQSLRGKRNPYDFDEAAYYRRLGVSAELIVDESDIELVEHRHGGLLYGFENLRMMIGARIIRIHHSVASKEVVPALLLGDRSRISHESRTAFREGGLSHLLAISGLHVGIIGMSFYFLVGLWLARMNLGFLRLKAARSALTGIMFIAFVLLSGGSTSVQRAVVMATVFLLGAAFGKEVSGWNMLGIAGCLLLAFDPSQIYAPGFQLSFAAVAGIFLWPKGDALSVPGTRAMLQIIRFLSGTVKISIAVTCSTLPVLLYHFGTAPLGGILANILAIPLTSILLLSGIISTAVGSALFFVDATDFLATLLFSLAQAASQALESTSLTVAKGILYPVSFIPVSLLLAFRSPVRRNQSWLFLLSISLCLTPFGTRSIYMSVTFLDVGQGDAALFFTPVGKSILVDTGRGYSSVRSIRAHLAGRGVEKIDLLIISHFHADHVGGLDRLLREIPISRIVGPSSHEKYTRPIEAVTRGDTLFVDRSVFIEVLAPSVAFSTRSENESSVVVRITYGQHSFLMTGDAERSIETDLISAFGSALESDIVKVAHHGSDTSSSRSFILRSSPRNAIISVGRKNRFKHPDPRVIQRWREAGVNVSTTALEGGISLSTDGILILRSRWAKR